MGSGEEESGVWPAAGRSSEHGQGRESSDDDSDSVLARLLSCLVLLLDVALLGRGNDRRPFLCSSSFIRSRTLT